MMRSPVTAPCDCLDVPALFSQVPGGASVVYEVELKDWNAIYDVSKDGGILVKCLGQLDTYGPLCDDAAQVKLTLEGRVMPQGTIFMGPIEKVCPPTYSTRHSSPRCPAQCDAKWSRSEGHGDWSRFSS